MRDTKSSTDHDDYFSPASAHSNIQFPAWKNWQKPAPAQAAPTPPPPKAPGDISRIGEGKLGSTWVFSNEEASANIALAVAKDAKRDVAGDVSYTAFAKGNVLDTKGAEAGAAPTKFDFATPTGISAYLAAMNVSITKQDKGTEVADAGKNKKLLEVITQFGGADKALALQIVVAYFQAQQANTPPSQIILSGKISGEGDKATFGSGALSMKFFEELKNLFPVMKKVPSIIAINTQGSFGKVSLSDLGGSAKGELTTNSAAENRVKEGLQKIDLVARYDSKAQQIAQSLKRYQERGGLALKNSDFNIDEQIEVVKTIAHDPASQLYANQTQKDAWKALYNQLDNTSRVEGWGAANQVNLNKGFTDLSLSLGSANFMSVDSIDKLTAQIVAAIKRVEGERDAAKAKADALVAEAEKKLREKAGIRSDAESTQDAAKRELTRAEGVLAAAAIEATPHETAIKSAQTELATAKFNVTTAQGTLDKAAADTTTTAERTKELQDALDKAKGELTRLEGLLADSEKNAQAALEKKRAAQQAVDAATTKERDARTGAASAGADYDSTKDDLTRTKNNRDKEASDFTTQVKNGRLVETLIADLKGKLSATGQEVPAPIKPVEIFPAGSTAVAAPVSSNATSLPLAATPSVAAAAPRTISTQVAAFTLKDVKPADIVKAGGEIAAEVSSKTASALGKNSKNDAVRGTLTQLLTSIESLKVAITKIGSTTGDNQVTAIQEFATMVWDMSELAKKVPLTDGGKDLNDYFTKAITHLKDLHILKR